MADDYHKEYYIRASESEIWNAFLDSHNYERITNIDSKGDTILKSGRKFIWETYEGRVVGEMAQVDTVNTNSTHIVYKWRFDDEKWRSIWPEKYFATTTFILGNQTGVTLVDMKITEIPGGEHEQKMARQLWEDQFVGRIEKYLEQEHPDLEEAA